MGVYTQNKKTLDPLDTKKWISDDGKDTKVFGNEKIFHIENEKKINIMNKSL